MTTFVLWGVLIAFLLLVVLAAIIKGVTRRLHPEPQGPYRRRPRP